MIALGIIIQQNNVPSIPRRNIKHQTSSPPQPHRQQYLRRFNVLAKAVDIEKWQSVERRLAAAALPSPVVSITTSDNLAAVVLLPVEDDDEEE
jgi:hypothetical protein